MPGLAVPERRMEFVAELVAGPAGALTETVTALDHEPVDHTMEDDPVVEGPLALLAGAGIGPLLRSLGQPDEVRDRVRRFLVEQADGEFALGGVEMRVCSGLQDCSFSCVPELPAGRFVKLEII
jgi:hypothetical protein